MMRQKRSNCSEEFWLTGSPRGSDTETDASLYRVSVDILPVIRSLIITVNAKAVIKASYCAFQGVAKLLTNGPEACIL